MWWSCGSADSASRWDRYVALGCSLGYVRAVVGAGEVDLGYSAVGVLAGFCQVSAHSDDGEDAAAGGDHGSVVAAAGSGVEDSVGFAADDDVTRSGSARVALGGHDHGHRRARGPVQWGLGGEGAGGG